MSALLTAQVDHPGFHVAKATETVRAHKECKILVGFDGPDAAGSGPAGPSGTTGSAAAGTTGTTPTGTAPGCTGTPVAALTATAPAGTAMATGAGSGSVPAEKGAVVMARLTVSCPRSAGTGQAIQWVYYLHGIV